MELSKRNQKEENDKSWQMGQLKHTYSKHMKMSESKNMTNYIHVTHLQYYEHEWRFTVFTMEICDFYKT